MEKMIASERQQKALEYAVEAIKKSPVLPYVEALYLYGSCARGEEKWDSDVDLFMEMRTNFLERKDLREAIRMLPFNVKLNSYREATVDLKIMVGNGWKQSKMLFYEDIREEGIKICI